MNSPSADGGGSLGALLAAHVSTDGRMMYRVAYNILHDPAAAEDACQQAFLKAWQNQERIRERGAMRSWLMQTVVNESLSVHRRKKVEIKALERRAQTTSPLVDDATEAGTRREEVLASVAQLPESVRTIVVLRMLEGMPGNQVKEVLAMSATEVSRKLHEGMELLRGKLSHWHVTAGEV